MSVNSKKVTNNDRYKTARNVTLIGALINLVLALGKMIVGYLGHSQALVADGVHSLSDLLTDVLVLFASRYGSEQADADHPYGHRRIETAATVGLAFILILAAGGIMWDAMQHLLFAEYREVSQITLWAAGLSIIANEWLYHYTKRAGKKIESELLLANAWHHRSDAATSVIVLVGLIGNLLGFTYLDAIMALAVGLLIAKMGWNLGWRNLRELVDTGADKYTLEKIERTIQGVPGVQALHQLRNRAMGGKLYIDVHILVDPNLTVSEGHFIADRVYRRLRQEHPKIVDIIVHVDPEDDEVKGVTHGLPARSEFMVLLKQRWASLNLWEKAEQIQLHYLDGKIHVDVWFTWENAKMLEDPQKLVVELKEQLADKTYIAKVKLVFYTQSIGN